MYLCLKIQGCQYWKVGKKYLLSVFTPTTCQQWGHMSALLMNLCHISLITYVYPIFQDLRQLILFAIIITTCRVQRLPDQDNGAIGRPCVKGHERYRCPNGFCNHERHGHGNGCSFHWYNLIPCSCVLNVHVLICNHGVGSEWQEHSWLSVPTKTENRKLY